VKSTQKKHTLKSIDHKKTFPETKDTLVYPDDVHLDDYPLKGRVID